MISQLVSWRQALIPHFKLGGLVMLAAAPLMAVAALVPPALVLPSVSLLTLMIAGAVAAAAWRLRAPRHGERLTLWDVAGACALIGFAAAALTDTQLLVETLGHPVKR